MIAQKDLRDADKRLRELFTPEEIAKINALPANEFDENIYDVFMETLSRDLNLGSREIK